MNVSESKGWEDIKKWLKIKTKDEIDDDEDNMYDMNNSVSKARKLLKVIEEAQTGYYQQLISKNLSDSSIDPRWVEAHLRLDHGTLDSLSVEEFKIEIPEIIKVIKEEGKQQAEKLALSYGL